MSHEWFEDWLSIYQADPWGETRQDALFAQVVWACLQPHSKKKLDPNRLRIKFRRIVAVPTPEEYKRKAMLFYVANGGGPSLKAQKLLPGPDNGQANQ